MVGCLGTLTVDLNCSTALGCIDTSRNGCQLTAHVYVFGCSHAHLTHLDRPFNPLINPGRMREGYGTWFVIKGIITFTSSHDPCHVISSFNPFEHH